MPDLLSTVLFVASVAAIAVGAAMIYLPAGLITAGVVSGLLLVVYERGRARTLEPPT